MKKDHRIQKKSNNIKKNNQDINILNIEEQLSYILSLPTEKRISILEEVQNPGNIIQRIPCEEIFYTLKNSEENEIRFLLKYVNNEQFNYLIDIDLWQKDKLSKSKVTLWLDRIHEMNSDWIVDKVKSLDPELFETFLKKSMYIKLKPEAQEVELQESLDDLPSNTIDGIFYYNFTGSESKNFIEKIISAFYQKDIEYINSIFLETINSTLTETEELAYRFRSARLKDHLIPDLEEAADIYSPLPDEILKKITSGKNINKKIVINHYDQDEESAVNNNSHIYNQLVLSNNTPILAKVLERVIKKEDIDRIILEFNRSKFKIMVADMLPLDDIDSYEKAQNKASSLLNLALMLSSKNENEALDTLLSNHIIYLIRFANQEIEKLSNMAWSLKKNGWLSLHPDCINLIDQPLDDLMKFMLHNKHIYPAHIWGENYQRPFRDPSDLQNVETGLRKIRIMGSILIDFLGITPDKIFSLDIKDTNPDDYKLFDIGLILRTSIAQWLTHGRLELNPVEKKDLPHLVKSFSKEKKPKDLSSQIIYEMKKNLPEFSDIDNNILKGYIQDNIKIVEDEFIGLKNEDQIDPRYITCFWLKI